MRLITFLATILVGLTSTATRADDEPVTYIVLPVEVIRVLLPDKGKDGVPFRVDDMKKPDEWAEIAIGKRLKHAPADRTVDKETVLEYGLRAKEGYIDIKIGWRAKVGGLIPVGEDGTLDARLSFVMTGGKWDVRVHTIKSHWTPLLPLPVITDEVNGYIEKKVKEQVLKIAGQLDDQTKKVYATLPPEIQKKVPLNSLSGSLAGDKFVVRGVRMTPYLDLDRVVDRRARDRRAWVVADGNVDKLNIAIIDRADLDATRTVVHSSIVVQDKIDGQSGVKLRTAPGASVVVRGRLDGQSTVRITAPEGRVEFHERIDGQSTLDIHAPGGHVLFLKRVDGQCKVTITAKTVTFHERLGGGRKTEVTLELPNNGKAVCPQYDAQVVVKYPPGPRPALALGRQDGEGQLAAVPVLGNWKQLVADVAKPGPKTFGQRDSAKGVVFDGELWLSGGFSKSGDDKEKDKSPHMFFDLWRSKNGVVWDHAVGDRAPHKTSTPPKDRFPYDEGSPLVVRNGGKELLAVGSSVWRYEGENGKTWRQLKTTGPALPPGGENAHAVVLGSAIYYVHTDNHNTPSKSGVYTSANGADWKLLNGKPEFGRLNGAAVVPFKNKLWVIGGAMPAVGGLAPPVNQSHVYSSVDGEKWEAAKNPPAWAKRDKAWAQMVWPGLAVQGGKRLWLVGGFCRKQEPGKPVEQSNSREIWYSDDGIIWQMAYAKDDIPCVHAPTCYVKDDVLYVVAGKGKWANGDNTGADVMNGVWSISLPPIPR